MRKAAFPWSDNYLSDSACAEIIEKIVRIDIAFSKKQNDSKLWYNSKTFSSQESIKEDAVNAQKKYDIILSAFKHQVNKVPIDYLKDEECHIPYFNFKKAGNNSEEVELDSLKEWTCKEIKNNFPLKEFENFRSVQQFLSENIVFKTTIIRQILVFPNFTQAGFGSFCIVALSDTVEKDDSIFKLLFEVNKVSYEIAIEEFGTLVRNESIKSAVAAIMSRNMSHNLGSHYLYYTKASLEKLSTNARSNGPYVRGAAKVLSYIQGRMDYLATIVANDKYPYGSVNFKSQIWDELTIDDFSKRHYGNCPNNEFVNNIENSRKATIHAQKEIDKLANLLNGISNLEDDAEITLKRKSVEQKIAELYRQLKKIDQKGSYNRTTNYLLANLIRSENYSRPDVISKVNEYRPLLLYVSLWDDNTNCYNLFKGDNDIDIMERERFLKDTLSKINLALPGGTMSCHAFYNILENFIRNSAKYSWTGQNVEELVFTVALKIDYDKKIVTCTIYDNKHDALKSRDTKHMKTLLEDLTTRLRCHTNVLGANYSVDKANKGLKEMLFSAVWLKANESDQSFADIISKIEDASPKSKIKLIKKYAFEFISVDDEGIETADSDYANIALRIILPLFTQVESLDTKRIRNLKELVKLHTDVIEISNDILPALKHLRPHESIFPRFYLDENEFVLDNVIKMCPFSQVYPPKISEDSERESLLAAYKLYQSIRNNLSDINSFKIKMGSFEEPGFSSTLDPGKQIYFSTHLSTQSTIKDIRSLVGRFAYVDTISGNNFTKTLEGLFSAGLENNYYKSCADLYLALKIKEAALTRISIIDERLFNNIRWNVYLKKKRGDYDSSARMDIRSTAMELSMKNIRVLNFLEKSRPGNNESAAKTIDAFPYLYGNQFYPTGPFAKYPDATNFLSIHLGLIEKMLKSKKMESVLGPMGQKPFSNTRINKLMDEIKKTFGCGDSHKIHISIHSGRGNFSQELEGPLKEYPFISLASLENAFNNSKFLLSQLFYNTIYIGKGEVNH